MSAQPPLSAAAKVTIAGLGGDCDAGVCQPTTLYQQAFPQGVATTATDVYWTQWATNGPIFKARKDGADAGPISPPQNSAAWIGLGSTEIYWTTQDAIFRCPFADCSNPQPFAGVTPADGAQDLLVGSRVMWSLDGIAANGAIVVTPEAMLDAGPVVGGLNSPCGVAMDASRIYWTEQGTGAANFIDGVVKSANLDGSNVMVIATGQNNPKRIAVDDKNVYFTTRNTVADAGTVAMCPIGTPCGATPTVLAYNQDRPTAIVVDSTSIYWSNQGDGTGLNGSLMRCAKPICASGPQTIVAHAYSLSLAQDATAIYWANWLPTGSVMRLAK